MNDHWIFGSEVQEAKEVFSLLPQLETKDYSSPLALKWPEPKGVGKENIKILYYSSVPKKAILPLNTMRRKFLLGPIPQLLRQLLIHPGSACLTRHPDRRIIFATLGVLRHRSPKLVLHSIL